jgi:hypothetical protein
MVQQEGVPCDKKTDARRVEDRGRQAAMRHCSALIQQRDLTTST